MHGVAAGGQRVADFLRHPVLNGQRAVAPPAQPGRVDGLLRAHAEELHVVDDLHERVRLPVAAGGADGEPGQVVAEDDDGTERVERPAPGRERVGVVLVEPEQRPAVVQHDAGVGHHEPGSEGREQALYQRDHVAVLVHRDHVDGVRVIFGGLDVDHRRPAGRVDGRGQLPDAGRVEQIVDGDAHGRGVGDLAVAVLESQPDRLGHGVQVVGRVVAEGGEVGVDLLKQRQLLEQRHPLRVRGERLHLEVLVAGADGLGPLRQVVGEVVGHEQPAALEQEAHDAPAEGPGVELLPALLLERPEGGGEVGAGQDLARLRGGAAGQEDAGRLRLPPQLVGGAGDVLGEPLRDGKPRRGEVDGRLQSLREGDRSEAAQPFRPGPDGAGDRDAEGAGARHPLVALGLQRLQRQGAARASRAVQGVGQLRGRVPVQQERVAAHPVHVGARDGQHRGRGDRRVHGEPARLQHAQAGLGGEGMPGGDRGLGAEGVASRLGVTGQRGGAGRRGQDGGAGDDSAEDRRGGRPRSPVTCAVCRHGLLQWIRSYRFYA